jgi:arylsulfatase A-like enzyme
VALRRLPPHPDRAQRGLAVPRFARLRRAARRPTPRPGLLPTGRGLFAALAALALAAACAPDAAPGPPAKPDVLLITVDTLRADHLGAYGYRLPTSPNLDRLAARSVLFEDCTAQRPKTRPSLASLLTGTYPRTTGVTQGRRPASDSLLLLSELFHQAHWATGAVVANFNVSRVFGFDQGFDRFVESWSGRWAAEAGARPFANRPGRVKEYTDAALVTDQGLELIRGLAARGPFFVWLHYMDPHGPYVPPASHRDLFAGDHPHRPEPLAKIPRYQLQRDAAGRPILDLGFYQSRYDAEIRYFDDQLGRLLGALAREGLDRELLVALTADHGESLGEQDYLLEHGRLPNQASVHVPCLVHAPWLPSGRRVAAPVGLVDLSATLVELAGLPVPAHFEGQSLAALVRGDPGAQAPAHVFVEAGEGRAPPRQAVREGRWKLVHRSAGGVYALYDVLADPDETHDLAAEQPERVARMATALSAWSQRGAGGGGPELDLRSLDPRAVRMLHDLGYVE